MKKKRIIGISLMTVFALSSLIAGGFCLREYRDARRSEKTFTTLTKQILDEDMPGYSEESDVLHQEEKRITEPSEAERALELYGTLHAQNPDFVGWISVEGTNINYPVMQSPERPDYYLNHSFDQTRSSFGVPFLDENCVIGQSNNLIIYGHHMKNGTMFSALDGYTDQDFYEQHPTIRFDTLTSFGLYEVIAVFRYDADQETFRYDAYTEMGEGVFGDFLQQVHNRQLYDTGLNAEYGDELLTLSTCEYVHRNGRLVVLARKVVL